MGNLGAYEEFTTLAKGMGGVETYLESIAAAAVSDAAPKLVAKGAGATVVVAAVVVAAAYVGNMLLAKRRAIQDAGQDAQDHLRAMADEASGESEPTNEETESPADPEESTQQ